MTEMPPPVMPGDKAPPCYGMSPGQKFYSFEEQYGRPAVLVLVGADAGTRLAPMIDGFIAQHNSFLNRNTDVYLIVDDNPAFVLNSWGACLPIRAVDSGSFLGRCGVGAGDGLVLLLDRNLRVALRSAPDAEAATACLECLDSLPSEAARDIAMPAPAIVLPNLISRGFCQELISLFEASPSIDGEVARIDAAGTIRSVVDHRKKHRRDMMIEEGTLLHRRLERTLLDRCAPEIAKAFQAKVAYADRILIARYDDTGGWFRRHRDNVAANVAFREFALSLNLNTGGYEGGQLLFPEYNDHRYSSPTGGGVIFSTSVLHEAAPVTRGSRYVLLTFFHGEAAEAVRQALGSPGGINT